MAFLSKRGIAKRIQKPRGGAEHQVITRGQDGKNYGTPQAAARANRVSRPAIQKRRRRIAPTMTPVQIAQKRGGLKPRRMPVVRPTRQTKGIMGKRK